MLPVVATVLGVNPMEHSPPGTIHLMHARELVDLAALAALHGSLVMSSDAPLPSTSLERYWSASKCRLDRWGRTLKRLSDTTPCRGTDVDNQEALGVLEEIVTGDVLARVWAAVLVGHDRHTAQDSGAVARTILVGQQEARNRAMSLLVNGPTIDSQHALQLNRLRRRAECWSDLLVGYLCMTEDVAEFAAEPVRAREFAHDFSEDASLAWSLLFASLRASFSSAFEVPSPNADLNAEIAAGVIACFAPELFDSTGLLRSLWMSRLQRTTTDTQCMIEDLFVEETSPQLLSKAWAPSHRDTFRRRF